MVDYARHTSKGEIVSEKKGGKQRQKFDSFHLLHIVRFLQKVGGVNKA